MHRASMMLGDAGLEQMFFLRPWDSFADYRLKEVKGVYECSSTMHPVGSICAGPRSRMVSGHQMRNATTMTVVICMIRKALPLDS